MISITETSLAAFAILDGFDFSHYTCYNAFMGLWDLAKRRYLLKAELNLFRN